MRLALILILAFTATACATAPSQQLPTPTLSSTTTPAPQPWAGDRHADEFVYMKADRTVWMANADGSDQRELISEPLRMEPEWSPDGKYLAYGTPRGTLELLEVDSGQKTTLDEGEDGLIVGAPPAEWQSATTIEYYKASSDPSVPNHQVAWAVTIDGKKSATPGLGHIDDSGAYCWLSTPIDGAVLCGRLPEGHQGLGRQLYLKWPDGEMHLIAENGEVGSWSPDGRWLAYYDNARGGSTMTGEVHILEVETGRNIELGTFNSDEGARWAPSQDRLIFDNLEIDPYAGIVKELFERPFTGVSWSPDLSKAEFIDVRGTLVVFDLNSGETNQLVTFDNFDAHRRLFGLIGVDRPWSPDGRYLAFSGFADSAHEEGVLYTFDTATGVVSKVLSVRDAGECHVSHSPDWSRLLVSQTSKMRESTISVANADGSSLTSVGEGRPLRQPWRPAEQ